jgi:hypothetical protein
MFAATVAARPSTMVVVRETYMALSLRVVAEKTGPTVRRR